MGIGLEKLLESFWQFFLLTYNCGHLELQRIDAWQQSTMFGFSWDSWIYADGGCKSAVTSRLEMRKKLFYGIYSF